MYEKSYGLDERPFDLSPNPRFLFMSPTHREVLANLQYGLSGRPGLTLVVGEAGTGKTSLVSAALEGGAKTGPIVRLSNPSLTRSEFFDYLADGFGFSQPAHLSKTLFLRELEAAITAAARAGTVVALVVDEAQTLPDNLLEEVRLLTNIEGPNGRSLAVALVGQPELAMRLDHPSFRQLKQRVALRCELKPLDLQETAAYIAARVRVAGGNPLVLFKREAVVAIHERSHGVPRIINVICDNALLSGFALRQTPVRRDVVIEVCREFNIDANPPPALASAVADYGPETVELDPHIASEAADSSLFEPARPDLAAEPARDVPARTGDVRRFGYFLVAVAIFGGVWLVPTWLGGRSFLVSRSLPSVTTQLVAPPPLDPTAIDVPTPARATVSFASPAATGTLASSGGSRAPTNAVDDAPVPVPRRAVTDLVPKLADRAAVPTPPTIAVAAPAAAPVAAPVTVPVTVPVAAPVLPQPAAPTEVAANASPDIPRADAAVRVDTARVDEEGRVRQGLEQYRVAYDGLNAQLAQTVWPGVNKAALERAFGGLTSQQLTFAMCEVRLRLSLDEALATCRGSARYVPKIGRREPRLEPRVWNFTLRKVDAEWKILMARTS